MARTRSTIVVPLLLVLLLFSSVLGVFGLWAARQFLEPASWEGMSSELIADPAIQSQVADQITASIVEGTNVESTLREALPPRLAPLAAPATVALRDGTRRVVLRVLQHPKVQTTWTKAVVATQRQAVNLIEGKGTAIRLSNGGGVIIDLRPMTASVASEIGLSPSLANNIPEEQSRIRLVQSDTLANTRKVLRLFKTLVVFFVILTPLLAIGAVAASPPGRRRGASMAVAVTLGLAALLVLAFHRIVGTYVVESVSDGSSAGPAAAAVWAISTTWLTTIASGVLLLGGILLVGALLAGKTRPARTIRGWLAPVLQHGALGFHAAVLAIGVAAVAIGLVPFVERPIGLVLLLVTLVAATEFVRRAAAEDDDVALAAPQAAGDGAESSPASALPVESSPPPDTSPASSDGPSPASSAE